MGVTECYSVCMDLVVSSRNEKVDQDVAVSSTMKGFIDCATAYGKPLTTRNQEVQRDVSVP